jgi:type IV secretory pathway VirB2 component (pilin)
MPRNRTHSHPWLPSACQRYGARLARRWPAPAAVVCRGKGPLEQIQESITGPVAGCIALAAVAIAGGMLIFGGELNDFARRLVYVVLVAGILLGATQIVGLFGATGASIGAIERQSGVMPIVRKGEGDSWLSPYPA